MHSGSGPPISHSLSFPLLASLLSLIRQATLTLYAEYFPLRSTFYPWWPCYMLQEVDLSVLYQRAPLISSFLLCSANKECHPEMGGRSKSGQCTSFSLVLSFWHHCCLVVALNQKSWLYPGVVTSVFPFFLPTFSPLLLLKVMIKTQSTPQSPEHLLVEVAWPVCTTNWPQIITMTGLKLWWETDKNKRMSAGFTVYNEGTEQVEILGLRWAVLETYTSWGGMNLRCLHFPFANVSEVKIPRLLFWHWGETWEQNKPPTFFSGYPSI